MPHQARLEKMAEFQQKGEDLGNNLAECQKLQEEAQRRLIDLEVRMKDGEQAEEREAELKKVRDEVKKLKRDEKSFEKLMEEHRREEKELSWNVDTISKEGFNKVLEGFKDLM